MRLTNASVVPAVLALFVSTVPAYANTNHFSVGSFNATYAAGAMHVQFTLVPENGIYGWLGYNWIDPSSVLVWRRRLTDPCTTPETFLAAFPWGNPGGIAGVPYVTADFVDAGVEPNTTYVYNVYGYGANPGRLDPVAFIGYVSTGVGLLCRGTLATDQGCQGSSQWAYPCDNSCFQNVSFNDIPADVQHYFNTPTTLAIYGEVNGLTGWCANVILPEFKITSVVEQSCVTAVEPTTWGAVKAMYR